MGLNVPGVIPSRGQAYHDIILLAQSLNSIIVRGTDSATPRMVFHSAGAEQYMECVDENRSLSQSQPDCRISAHATTCSPPRMANIELIAPLGVLDVTHCTVTLSG
jgi:hypothetical protein